MLVGRVDELRNSVLYGWAFNTASTDEHLLIKVNLTGQVIASGVASMVRPDLPDAGIGLGDHAFEIIMPPNVQSFHGLGIVAESRQHGEILLPIATSDDRKLDELFEDYAARYESVLVELKNRIDALAGSTETSGDASDQLPETWDKRLAALENRMEAAEISLMRIDQTLRKWSEEQKRKSGGWFGRR